MFLKSAKSFDSDLDWPTIDKFTCITMHTHNTIMLT